MDEAYRLAHLPLVAPCHPRVIPAREGRFYAMGRHPPVVSLVLPVPGGALLRSAAYQALDAELRTVPFARKLAWEILPRRQDRLHATICGGLGTGDAPPALGAEQRRALAAVGPIEVELRGLFSGNVNVGRLYLRAYPRLRGDGTNPFRAVQRALDRPETDLWPVGLHNLTDDLNPAEAAALDALIARWWDRPLLRFAADCLWLLRARDDLVLDAAVAETVALVPA